MGEKLAWLIYEVVDGQRCLLPKASRLTRAEAQKILNARNKAEPDRTCHMLSYDPGKNVARTLAQEDICIKGTLKPSW